MYSPMSSTFSSRTSSNQAVPSAELLELLRVVTYEDWTYFYYRFP